MVVSSKAVMRVVILVAVFLGAVSAAPNNGMLASLSPLEHTELTIPEEYIVVFKKDANQAHVEEHMISINDMLATLTNSNYSVQHTYHVGSFRGYSARMDDQTLDRVRSMKEVDYVERNQHRTYRGKQCVTQPGASTWGLSRISHETKKFLKQKPNSYNYVYNKDNQGEGVDIYILDTGIAVNNPEFKTNNKQRAKWGVDFVRGKNDEGYQQDEDGHGTAVAGVAMSNNFGVAKKATAIAVRVLDCEGGGDISHILAGYNYVCNEHKRNKNPAVANASFGGAKVQAETDCVKELINEGVLLVAAAGNDGDEAFNESPASTSRYGAVTVASSDENDKLASSSNYGERVTIIAPGVDIWTTGNDKKGTGYYKKVKHSGTSLAAPFVTGVVANMLSGDKKLTPKELKDRLITGAVKNAITYTGKALADNKTPNLLLNDEC